MHISMLIMKLALQILSMKPSGPIKRKTCQNIRKLDEIPYDFIRKRLSIAVTHGNDHLMVTKGALTNILEVCSFVEMKDGNIVDIASMQDQIQKDFVAFSNNGFRTLGIAYKNCQRNR